MYKLIDSACRYVSASVPSRRDVADHAKRPSLSPRDVSVAAARAKQVVTMWRNGESLIARCRDRCRLSRISREIKSAERWKRFAGPGWYHFGFGFSPSILEMPGKVKFLRRGW